jgi:tetratricopeptide (TPR) repeat protein
MYYETYMDILQTKHLDPQETVSFYEQAVKVNPQSAKARRTLATVIRNSDTTKVVENFAPIMSELMAALKLDPHYIPTHITIANTYMFRAFKLGTAKDRQTALDWLNKAQKIDPEDFRVHYARGHVLYVFKRYDKAIKAYERALKLSPDDLMALEGIANSYNGKAYELYLKGKDLHLGLQLIDKAIALKPNDGIILSTKAELLYKMGRYEEAYELIKTALAYGPEKEEMLQDKINIEKALARKGK